MIETLLALLISLISFTAAPSDGGSCEAISGQYADGTEVGVVVIGCDPGGVLPESR